MLIIAMEPQTRKIISIAACLNIGHILAGFGVSWSAPMIPILQDPDRTPLLNPITDTQAGFVGSAMFIGAFGSFSAGFISNIIGRRRTLILGDVINIVAYLILTWPKNLAMVYIGRTLVGLGATFISIMNLVYIGEITPPNIRGLIFTSTGVFHNLGSLLVVSTGPYFNYSIIGYIAIAVTLMHMAGCFYIPESPYYHVLKGDENAARDVLITLGRTKDNLETELREIIAHSENKDDIAKFSDLFTIKSNLKAFLICITLVIIQQTNGNMAVALFATTIFENAGSFIRADISTIIITLMSLCGTLVAPIFIERCGRKVLLLVSTGCCCIAMTVLGIYFYLDLNVHPLAVSIGWLPLVSLVMSLFTFNIGLNIIPNTLIGEMFKPNVRSTGSALSMSSGWVMGLVSTTSFVYVVAALGNHITFWLFAIVNGVGVMFTIFCVPETKGKSLSEISEMLER